jgi:dTDP-4-amino-4,6-dideoxygalactose transaminase
MASEMKKTGLPAAPPGRKYSIIRPSLPDLNELRKEMAGMWESGQVTMGGHVQAFEDAVAKKIGVRHAVAVSSCTSGLILAVRALELTGEAIVPSFTFAATVHALLWNGVTPVFCDSETGTLNLDPRKAEENITGKTSAILPVSIFGVPPRVAEFQRLARNYHVRLLYDSAQALGARVNGTYAGGFGDVEVFSLSPTKVVTAIEGGMVTTNDDVLAKRIRSMRDYGKAEDGEDMEFIGLSARMSEVNAAVGLLNFTRVAKLIRHRGKLVALYKKLLSGIPGIHFQEIPPGISPSQNYMVIFIDGAGRIDRDGMYMRLMDEGIQTKRYFFPAVHEMMAYRKYGRKFIGRLPVAERASREGLALPLHGGLNPDDVRFICSRIHDIISMTDR